MEDFEDGSWDANANLDAGSKQTGNNARLLLHHFHSLENKDIMSR